MAPGNLHPDPSDAPTGAVTRSLRFGMHGLFALLLGIGTVRAVQEAEQQVWMLLGCLLLAAWYVLGFAAHLRTRLVAPSAPQTAVDQDALGAWRRGDEQVVRALAELELKSAGVRLQP